MKAFILLISTYFLTFFHAAGIAEYHYFMENDYVILKFEMDKHELEHYRINKNCQQNKLFDICIQEYLLSKTDLQLNNQKVDFDFVESSTYNDHIIFNFKSKKTYKNINDLQIENTCFYEVNKKFKNRIRIDIKQFQKSFLLTKGKGRIQL